MVLSSLKWFSSTENIAAAGRSALPLDTFGALYHCERQFARLCGRISQRTETALNGLPGKAAREVHLARKRPATPAILIPRPPIVGCLVLASYSSSPVTNRSMSLSIQSRLRTDPYDGIAIDSRCHRNVEQDCIKVPSKSSPATSVCREADCW
jgi:hypothetical protein